MCDISYNKVLHGLLLQSNFTSMCIEYTNRSLLGLIFIIFYHTPVADKYTLISDQGHGLWSWSWADSPDGPRHEELIGLGLVPQTSRQVTSRQVTSRERCATMRDVYLSDLGTRAYDRDNIMPLITVIEILE